nr:hypothetical protein [Ktedonobacteraceae bacterium]
MNKTQATVAVCEIELKNGSNCGVQAIWPLRYLWARVLPHALRICEHVRTLLR